MNLKNNNVKIVVIDFEHCEKKKCSAQIMLKSQHAVQVKPKAAGAFKGIILTPDATRTVSSEDYQQILNQGIATIDCSWKKYEEDRSFIDVAPLRKQNQRLLPFLIASNTINYGRPWKLNCVEAYASVLQLVDQIDQGYEILDQFKQKNVFFELNQEYLDLYKGKNEQEVKTLMDNILNKKEEDKFTDNETNLDQYGLEIEEDEQEYEEVNQDDLDEQINEKEE